MVNSRNGDAMAERMEELPARVEAVEQKIDALSASVDARFDAVDARFDALMASMNAEFEQIAAAFVEQRQYTEFAFDRLGQEMRTGFNRLDGRLSDLDGRLERVERKLDRFIDTQSATNALVGRRLQRLERSI